MKLDKDFLNVVAGPIQSCWQSIGFDCGECNNPEAIEACIDANRLAMYPGGEHGRAADAAIHAACTANDYGKVLRFLAKHIKLA